MLLRICLFLCISCFTSSVATAQHRPWWNPLGIGLKDDEQPAVRTSNFYQNIGTTDSAVKPASAWVKLKNMKPKFPEFEMKFPSLKKLGNSTKQAFIKTGDFLNPFNKAKKETKPAALFPENQGYQPQYSWSEKPKKSSGFRWFWEEDEPEQVESIGDWLRQPNPLLREQDRASGIMSLPEIR